MYNKPVLIELYYAIFSKILKAEIVLGKCVYGSKLKTIGQIRPSLFAINLLTE